MKFLFKQHKLRSITRKLGINSLLFKIIYGRRNYEQNFDDAFKSLLKQNMIIYDCGANVGCYTKEFSKIVGEGGKVYAIEPSDINGIKLMNYCKCQENVVLLKYAIGRQKSKLWIQQGEDEIGANSSIKNLKPEKGNEIEMTTLENLFDKFEIPDALKIDIEGYELDALLGVDLKKKEFQKLTIIGIEVHSKLMELRGLEKPQERIQKLLENSGFSIKWTDFSHLVAIR